MALVRTNLRASVAVSAASVQRPARASRVTTTCKSAPVRADDHVSRRQSLGLLVALPMILSLRPAQAVDLGDFRKFKRRSRADQSCVNLVVRLFFFIPVEVKPSLFPSQWRGVRQYYCRLCASALVDPWCRDLSQHGHNCNNSNMLRR